jgi:hypothetical protein
VREDAQRLGAIAGHRMRAHERLAGHFIEGLGGTRLRGVLDAELMLACGGAHDRQHDRRASPDALQDIAFSHDPGGVLVHQERLTRDDCRDIGGGPGARHVVAPQSALGRIE